MNPTKTLALLGACITIAGCSTPPKPPTVDDSTKRPVNVSEAVNLQMCRSELSAAKVVLAEFTGVQSPGEHGSPFIAAWAPSLSSSAAPGEPPIKLAAPSTSTSTSTAAAEVPLPVPNHVFIVRFATGSADFTLAAGQQAKLLEQARAARFIVIRGRTDAATESMDETHLAQRRSQAAYNFLIHAVKLPREAVRVSWQGAGDQADPGAGQLQRQANRRVEIEMYQTKPESELLVG